MNRRKEAGVVMQGEDGNSYFPNDGRNRDYFVSIVIPFRKFSQHVVECVNQILMLDYSLFEIILLPDEPFDSVDLLEDADGYLRIIPTGSIPPGLKRNIGTANAKGSIIAFIDDDAFPDQSWLRNAVRYFADENVAGVGGPNITPPNDGVLQKAGGMVLQSWMGSGGLSYRYKSGLLREDDDLPTVNLIIRKEILDKLGGFDIKYWPGDDTYLCLQITRHLGKKLIYSPDVIVYHHRRPLFVPHMRQIWSYGKHRGYFAKRFPENSRRPLYFAPSLMVILIALSPLLLLLPPILGQLFVSMMILYLAIALIEALRTRNIKLSALVFLGIVLTHLTYGIGFLKGLFSKELRR